MNTKLTDVGILQMIRETEDLYSFGGDAFELDITRLSASQAAGRIHEHIGMTCRIQAYVHTESADRCFE